MDFTEPHKQNGGLVAFSPGGSYILTAVANRLIIRRVDSFQVALTCVVDDAPSESARALASAPTKPAVTPPGPITHATWSADAELVLAACARSGRVTVFKMRDEAWRADIAAGPEGLVRVEFAPDARSVLCFSEWGLRVTVWSLVTGAATYIQSPLHPDRACAFRADGRYFVLAERHKSRDTIGVYDVKEHFRLVRHYHSPTSALSSIALSPTGNYLAVWEGPLEYKLHIVSLSGEHQGTFAPSPDPGFGIRAVAWHPLGHYLAVAGWDDKIYVLSSLNWQPIATFELQARIAAGVTIWREPFDWLTDPHGPAFVSYERLRAPHVLSLVRADTTKAYPKAGAAQLAWNASGSYLLARFDSAPTVAFLYAFPLAGGAAPSSALLARPSRAPALASVLLHTRPLAAARWNPRRPGALALCAGAGALHVWSDEWAADGAGAGEMATSASAEEMAECIAVPAERFEVRDLAWAPDGKGLVLIDKDAFVCAFEVQSGEGEDEDEDEEP